MPLSDRGYMPLSYRRAEAQEIKETGNEGS